MEEKYRIIPFVFILATLNRETIIFIIPVLFFVRKRWDVLLYVIIYVAVKYMLSFVFSDSDGQGAYIQPVLNFLLHVKYYWATIILVFGGWTIFLLFVYNVQFMRKEFAIFVLLLLPVFVAIYGVVGYAFEIRVFAEIMPILFMGAFMKGERNETEKAKAKEISEVSDYW
jgi:hypothetical protein